MVGMLGGLWTILGATLALNLVTLGVLLWAPRPRVLDASIHAQLPLLASVSITYQWGVAVLMLAIWLTYRHTLRSLGSAFERAQQLDNLKAQFITHINHELRTPIMTLQGYIEYLRLGRESLPEAELDAALDRASRTTDTLVGLLSNILDIRRIETQQSLPAQPVRVREALDAALALIDPRLGSGLVRDLRLSLADDLEIWGDRGQLQQILTNLLSNALKYSPPGTPVEISGGVMPASSAPSRQWAFSRLQRALPVPAGNAAEIVVRDYGQGIPQDQAHLLFNRFARLPRDLASNVEGSGLGLYLCRVFAEAMGGTIWVESTGVPGEGSEFHLRLQLPPAPSRTPAALPATAQEDATPWPASPTVAGESAGQSLALPPAGTGGPGASGHE
jgi:signal transduction histidine kinase